MVSQLTHHLLPKVPVNLVASNITTTTIDLDWDAVNLASGYDVYVDSVLNSSVTVNETTIIGLTTATLYDIYVVAKDNTFNTVSAPSNTITVTTV